ncbi:hypothetical protein [Virgisporangium aurantiacum]|uniref:Uncharacterized protein n=1 Tax=Virgisporangium aurantiacum TaxID=175570 RepID=A0A8J3ZIK5_9ACTN|nr:hypothetical protein [Virgisporangium aurantiacum]GIJ62063.1 hypothetical protein Vau01_095790 [Virgisporangium aurantiacum]
MKFTITEALHEMRRLQNVDAGRLRGVAVNYYLDELTGLDRLPAPWGSRLVELIEARRAGTITADTPHYLVYSDRMPVAWATVHAAVVTPTVAMSTVQAKHQRQVAAVLADLDRDILEGLADQRDLREGRPDTTEAHHEPHMVGALRVAPADDPTATRWVRPSADLDETRADVARTLGISAADALIVSAVGYGHHGYHAHRLSLELVCAMQATAAANDVSLATVGNWIDHGLATNAEASTLPGRFAAVYSGRYTSEADYAHHRMDTQGWTGLLRDSGMEAYFDLPRYARHLFVRDVFGIGLDGAHPWRGVEVFHRPAALRVAVNEATSRLRQAVDRRRGTPAACPTPRGAARHRRTAPRRRDRRGSCRGVRRGPTERGQPDRHAANQAVRRHEHHR